MRDTHVLITGGLGAIGSALSRALLARGVRRLTIIDDCSSSSPVLCQDILADPRASHIHASITDSACLQAIFAEDGPSTIFHLAAHFANQNSVEHPIEDTETNSLGTVKVLEAAREAHVAKFIFASSSCVYGNSEDFAIDTRNFHLDTPYAINKLHGEYLVQFYHEFHGLNTTILRYFNSFGPGEMPGPYRNVVPNFFARAMRAEPLPLTGSPEASRDFNYVGNAVAATLLAAEKSVSSGKIYNVGSGQETTIGVLADLINRIAGSTAGVVLQPRRAWDSVDRRKADITKTVTELGYAPVIDLEAQLTDTYRWLRDHRTHFPSA